MAIYRNADVAPPPGRRKPQQYEVDENGCWVWILSLCNGYAQMRVGGKKVFGHRWYWEQANGPIPPGLVIDHVCGNKACVNPEHLQAVTNRENLRRGPHTRLTREEALRIREAALSGQFTLRQIAAAYGISHAHVWAIKAGRVWDDLYELRLITAVSVGVPWATSGSGSGT